MLFYILFIFCITFLLGVGCVCQNKSNLVQWLVFGILFCVAGFRHHVGIDYDSYVHWYITKSRDNNLEFGFVALMNLFRGLNSSYHIFFVIFSFFTILLAFLGIKNYTKNSTIALLFFFLIPELYLCSFNLIRQSFAVCVSFYAFYFLLQKKYFVFAFLMFLGISIHNSAILPLLVFILVFKYADRIKSKYIVIALIGSLVLSYLNIIEISEFLFRTTRYSYYFDSPRVSVSICKTVVLNSIAFFVLFYYDELKEKYDYQKYILLLYFCTVIFMNLFNSFANIERLTYFFKIFEIVVIADLICSLSKERKLWLLSFFYIYYFSSFVHTLNTDFEIKSSSNLIPFQTFIFEQR